ncbi:cytochrome P450 [Phenylobacterium sp. LjRoot225]|uniref:cytochrome P450 n=1 Tax=Phenylobacterium sp. LjRoot225 TaxID=3342285 RepID=UPI003ECED1EA
MNTVLIADDTIYEELYDVRREAEHAGNLVEEDMNPAMNALRERAPVQKGFLRELLNLPFHQRHVMAVGRQGYTSFTWEACNTAFRDHERFSSRIMHHPAAGEEQRLGILEMDEPQHRCYRNMLQPMFIRPKTLTWWRDRFINEIVDTLVSNLKSQDRAELNLQLCARVPVHTITRAIGMQGDDALVFRHAIVKSSAHGRISVEEARAASETVDRMLIDLIAKRRAAPGDDVITGLLQAELELPDGTKRPLTEREIVINARLVMLAGGGTSWRQFGITLWALLTHRDQLEAVKADRSLVDKAIEESVRWNPTDPVFSRLVAEDTELEGVALPAGAVLEICLGAANRDPARWSNPDAYDLHRPPQGHMGFGMGAHQCLGMNVARSEIHVGVNALLDAFPNLRLDPDQPAPYLTGGLEQRGMSAIPVLLR